MNIPVNYAPKQLIARLKLVFNSQLGQRHRRLIDNNRPKHAQEDVVTVTESIRPLVQEQTDLNRADTELADNDQPLWPRLVAAERIHRPLSTRACARRMHARMNPCVHACCISTRARLHVCMPWSC